MVAAIIGFILYVGMILFLTWLLDRVGVPNREVIEIGKFMTYSAFGIGYLCWKWPYSLLRTPVTKFRSFVKQVPKIAGNNFAERVSTLILIVCIPVTIYWVFSKTNFHNSQPWSYLFDVFNSMWPGTSEWKYLSIGWATKGITLGLFGRFLFTPLFTWLKHGKVGNQL